MSARDRFDSDRETSLRRRAQLHFQVTFAYGVTWYVLQHRDEFPALHDHLMTSETRELLNEDLTRLGRNRWTLDTYRTMRGHR